MHFSESESHNLKSSRIIEEYLLKSTEPKLQIGCGHNLHEGWLNTDLNYSEELNIAFLDAGKTFPFNNETFVYVYSEHIFEYLTLEESLNMLNESYRVLKPGGYIRIATPDLDFLIKLYLYKTLPVHQNYVKWSSGMFYNSANRLTNDPKLLTVYVINNFFKDWGHQVIHNFDTIKDLLLKAGFRNITKEKMGKSNIPELVDMEKHGKVIPPEFNELESLIVQAVKY